MQSRIPDPAMLLYSAGQRKLLFEKTDYNRSRDTSYRRKVGLIPDPSSLRGSPEIAGSQSLPAAGFLFYPLVN